MSSSDLSSDVCSADLVRRDCEAGDIVAHPAEEARSGVAAEITADRTAVAERQGEAVDRKGIGFAEEAERAYRVGESAAYRSRAVGKEDLPGVSARPGAPAVPDGADIDRHAERDLGPAIQRDIADHAPIGAVARVPRIGTKIGPAESRERVGT